MTAMRTRARSAVGLGVLACAALFVGRLSAERPATAVRLVLLPVVAIAIIAPAIPLVAAVTLIPYQLDVLGPGGLEIGPSDVLLGLGFGGVIVAMLTGERVPVRKLSPIVPVVVIYFAALTVAWANLPTTSGVTSILQRVELVVAALVVGAYLAYRGMLDRALTYYVLAAAVLAVTAIVVTFLQGAQAEEYLGIQKNPAGQSIANALLIVLFLRKIPARVPFGAVLALGLIAAQSRGALLATAIAFALAATLMSSNRRVRSLVVVPLLLGIFYGGFSALPSAQQERLVNTTPGGDVATETRQNYADDAIAKFKSAPVLGTGVGLYEAGDRLDATYTIDPHNVLLLEAAEGGAVLFGGFALLGLGSFIVLVRRRQRHPMVIVALAVQTSTVLHGVVDVYWVRGTPVMGWLLIGAALFLASTRSPASSETGETDEEQQEESPADARLSVARRAP